MSNGVDRLIAYRTMRAVQRQVEESGDTRTRPETRWERWQAFMQRLADRLLL